MIKFITDIAPLIAFFIGYKQGDLKTATIYTIITSIICLAVYFLIYKKLEKVTLISSGLLLFTASITIITDNLTFIKMKPTILYLIFAGILLFSNFNKRPVLKYAFGNSITLKNESCWYVLSYRFCYFFLSLAIINEIIWRSCSEQVWVNFKVFAIIPITLMFTCLQLPFILKNKVE